MNQSRDFKIRLINELRISQPYFKEDSAPEYRCRCPICGDSQKNLNTGHFYMKIDINDNSPILYNCFLKPEESGILTSDILSLLIQNREMCKELGNVMKHTDVKSKSDLKKESEIMSFDVRLPEIEFGRKTDYIKNRLGIDFKENDFYMMKAITSIKDFLNYNNIKTVPKNFLKCMDYLDKNFVGFLSNGNSHILLRDTREYMKSTWIKYPIFKDSSKNKLFYSMESIVDLYTDEKIIINLCEGVFDTLSVSFNYFKYMDNCINIAVTGKYYYRIILYLIHMGFVGDNVIVNIFSDNDEMFNNKNNNYDTKFEWYQKTLGKVSNAFGGMYIYHNMKSKDFGVPISEIAYRKRKI